jgi:hypothetical protein
MKFNRFTDATKKSRPVPQKKAGPKAGLSYALEGT